MSIVLMTIYKNKQHQILFDNYRYYYPLIDLVKFKVDPYYGASVTAS